jgi:hypothetical protein
VYDVIRSRRAIRRLRQTETLPRRCSNASWCGALRAQRGVLATMGFRGLEETGWNERRALPSAFTRTAYGAITSSDGAWKVDV